MCMMAPNGQPEHKASFYYLELCCRLVAERLGHAAFAGWTNGDYIRLSSILSHQTGTQISPNTLKRIFGKLKTPERYFPQKATRDALARYAGFTDWDSFQRQHPLPTNIEEVVIPVEAAAPRDLPPVVVPVQVTAGGKKSLGRRRGIMVVAVVAILAAAAAWWWWPAQQPVTILPPEAAQLVCNNPEGENPHSAVFRLTLASHFKGNRDSFYVNFGDGRKPKRIQPGILLSHYYEVPGRYNARLQYYDRDVDTAFVYLKTHGWTATANVERDTMRVYPVTSGTLFKGPYMAVDTRQVYQAGVDTNKTFYIEFVNTRPSTIDGDHFEMTARVTTSAPRAGVRCSQVRALIYGERGQHSWFVMKPGCSSWIKVQFSEIHKDGEQEDLRALEWDLTNGGTIRLRVVDKQASLWVNDRQVYAMRYERPLGNIYGVNISFAGIGTVHDLQVKDLRTGEMFRDGFPAP